MFLSLAAALLVAGQTAGPSAVATRLDEARALIRSLQFREATVLLEKASQMPNVGPGELRPLRELLAYCQVAEGRKEEAENTYRALLEADPSAELEAESSSPKVLALFRATKTRLYSPDYVRLDEEPAPAGQVSLSLIDPWRQVRALTVFERHDGGVWVSRTLTDTARTVSFRVTPGKGGEVEWYVEALSETGVVAHVGSAESPRRVSAPMILSEPAPKVASGRRTAGWVLLGVGVVAAAVATGLSVGGWDLRQAARDSTKAPGDFADTALAAETQGKSLQGWGTGLFVGGGVLAATSVVLVW